MTNQFIIVNDRSKIDMDLMRTADDSLPRVMQYMNSAIPFAGLVDGQTVAVCMMEERDGLYNIVNFAVKEDHQGKGYSREILLYALDYVRTQGGRYVEIGCGNANLRLIAMYQKLGFRFIGVWPDYYLSDSKVPEVENSIVNRDMVRFRMDLQEKRLSTIGYDASGRT